MSEQQQTWNPMTVAKEIFPTMSDENLETIIWSCTGFPCFWPKGNVLENFRIQLWEAKVALSRGYSVDHIFKYGDALLEKDFEFNRVIARDYQE